MAPFAGNARVLTCERKPRGAMVKRKHRFPGIHPVTLCTFPSQCSFVDILMADRTIPAKAKIRPPEIFHPNLAARRWSDILLPVALPAFHAIVSAFQREACLGVYEGTRRETSGNWLILHSGVLCVAGGAALFIRTPAHQLHVVAPALSETQSNFLVAVHASRVGSPAPKA